MTRTEALAAIEQQRELKRWLISEGPVVGRDALTKSGGSLRKFAESLEVSPTYISCVVRRQMKPGRPVVEKCLRILLEVEDETRT